MNDMIEVKRVEIKATELMKEVMENYFREMDEASRTRNKKIAWCSSVGPAELALSMGYLVYLSRLPMLMVIRRIFVPISPAISAPISRVKPP
jgi:hypothetical protein